MQFEYDPERLIEEVKKRPGIWDYDHPDYRAKSMRYNLWNEIVHELVQTDIKMSKSEMRELEIQLQKKWKSIRDCFQKYIINPRRTRRPYIYSKQLQFLLKDQELPKRFSHLNGEASSESEEPPKRKVWRSRKKLKLVKDEQETSDEEQEEEDSMQFENLEDSRDCSNEETSIVPPPSKVMKPMTVNVETVKPDEFAFANVDAQSKSDGDDPDKLFLISLLPHLKSIPEEFRLNVKMELMQVLRSANYATARNHNVI